MATNRRKRGVTYDTESNRWNAKHFHATIMKTSLDTLKGRENDQESQGHS